MAPAAKPSTTAQEKSTAPSGTKAATDTRSTTDSKTATDTKAATDSKTATDARTGNTKTVDPKAGDTKVGDTKAGDSKAGVGATTGNAATSATAAPPAEKRTQITSAIRQEKVEEVRNVNFNVSVGVAVPSTVRFYPVPTRVVEIYPEWRGYDFIVVNGRYVILRPRTHEIVYIIEG
jgi:hypothetical protein